MKLFKRKNKKIKAQSVNSYEDMENISTEDPGLSKLDVITLKNISSNILISLNDTITSLSTLNDDSNSQNKEISNVKSMITLISDNMSILYKDVSTIKDKINSTDVLSTKSLNSIDNLNSSLKGLQVAFKTSSSTVNDLVSKLESVNSITDSINQIATQTNLLSLNAAIEAARAGEAGKGFSVVAGEVRKLAENSKAAVQSITNILDEIKADIINASNTMNTGNEAIDTQHSLLIEAKANFQGIKNSINASSTEIEGCLNLLNDSENSRVNVITLIDNISHLSEENLAVINEIVTSMNSNSPNIENLESIVSKL